MKAHPRFRRERLAVWWGMVWLTLAGCSVGGSADRDGGEPDGRQDGGDGKATYLKPEGYASVTFFVDDTANQTYQSGQIRWKGSWVYDDRTNIIVHDPTWAGGEGPYPVLYDDGPIASGGHERPGAPPGDHIFSVEVYVQADEASETRFQFGAVNEKDNWIWEGAYGEFVVPAGWTDRIDAGGAFIHAFGTYDLILTLDSAALHQAFLPFDPVSDSIAIAGSMNSWDWRELLDDGEKMDAVAGDGIYTYHHAENLGAHDGLLYADQHVQFLFRISGVEYKQVDALSEGLSAKTNCQGPDEWEEVPIFLEPGSSGLTQYTTVAVCEGDDPVLQAVEPPAGTVLGGTQLSVMGEAFREGAVVAIDGRVLNTAFVDASHLTAVTSPHAAGAVEVSVINPGGRSASLPAGYWFVLGATPDLDDGVIETDSGRDWHAAFLAGENTEVSDWGPNHADRLYVAFDDQNLYLGLVGWVEVDVGNALVVYLDVDFGAQTGVADMNNLTDVQGALDNSISSVCSVTVPGFGAEFAVGTKGMAGVDAADLLDDAGLRLLVPPATPNDFHWLGATVRANPDDHAVEVAIPMETLLGGPVPSEGARMAVFVRLVNQEGLWLSNQTLPMDDPGNPDQVGQVFVFDVRSW